MHLRIKTNISDMDFYITDTHDEYVEKFLINVSSDTRPNKSLTDNPFTYKKLKSINFKYMCLCIDKKDEPYIGWFAVQYDKLPENVIRIFTRYYKLNNRPKTTLSFLKEEHRLISVYLKSLLDIEGIDTVFWTRHSETTDYKDQFKYEKFYKHICSKEIDMYHAKAKVKGINQHITYFNAWQNAEVDHSFLTELDKI